MNKKFLLGMVSLCSVAVLGACGGGSNSSDGDSGGDGDKVTLTYGLWDKQQAPVYEEIAKEFEKENPDVDVKIEITPWGQYWTKLETAATGKNAPDVFWMNIPRAIDYVDNGILEPLDDVKYDKGKIADQYLDAYTEGGKLYGIPKDYDTNALWYNKAMFDEKGIAYPDESWDWDKWKEVAKELTDTDKDVYGMAIMPTWQGGYYETMYEAGGSPFKDNGKESNFDSPESIEGLKYWYSFVEDGSGTPIEKVTNTLQTDLLLSGKVAMIVDGSYQTPVIFADEFGKENIDVAPIPKGPKDRVTTSNSVANVVYSGSKHKEAAKKFVEYLSTKESMEKVAESGVVIPSYEGSADAWTQAYPDKNLKVFVDAVDYAVALPKYKNSSAATAIEQEPINQIWKGEVTVEEGAKDIAKQANEILAKN